MAVAVLFHVFVSYFIVSPWYCLTLHVLQTTLLYILDRLCQIRASIPSQVFDYRAFSLSELGGWVTAAGLLITAAGPTPLMYVFLVGRAKRSVDFAFTLFCAHAVATACYSGLPSSITWWVVNLLAAAVLAGTCEALCMRIELQEIVLPTYDPSQSELEPGKLSRPVLKDSTADQLLTQAASNEEEQRVSSRRF